MPFTDKQRADGEVLCAKSPPEHHPHVVDMPYPGVKSGKGAYPNGATICCRCRTILDGTVCGTWKGPHDDYNDQKEEA